MCSYITYISLRLHACIHNCELLLAEATWLLMVFTLKTYTLQQQKHRIASNRRRQHNMRNMRTRVTTMLIQLQCHKQTHIRAEHTHSLSETRSRSNSIPQLATQMLDRETARCNDATPTYTLRSSHTGGGTRITRLVMNARLHAPQTRSATRHNLH